MPVDRPPTHFANNAAMNRSKTLEIMNISQSNAVVEVNHISSETRGTFARTLGTRPRSSQRQSAHSTHVVDKVQGSRILPHRLGVDKALQKKLGDCDRNHPLDIAQTTGGYVITCLPVYYELLKNNLGAYISNSSNLRLSKDFECQLDQSGATQSLVLRVNFKNGKHYCTINLYNTSSKIVVNGKSSPRFIEEHFPVIHSHIKKQLSDNNISISSLNQCLITSLESALSNRLPNGRDSIISPIDKDTLTTASKCAPLAGTTHEDFSQHEVDSTCPLCKFAADGETVYCDICFSWIHWACEGLNKDQYMELQNSPEQYTCTLCMTNSDTGSSTVHTSQVCIPMSTRSGLTPTSSPMLCAGASSPMSLPTVTMATTVTSSLGSSTTTLALNTRPSCATTSKTTNAYPSIEKKSPYNKRTPTPVQQHPKPHLVNKVDTHTSQPSDCSQPSSTNSHTKDPQHKKLQQWEKDLKKREVHVSHSERQTAAQISTIISLKEKVKDLEQSNRCIKLEMATKPLHGLARPARAAGPRSPRAAAGLN